MTVAYSGVRALRRRPPGPRRRTRGRRWDASPRARRRRGGTPSRRGRSSAAPLERAQAVGALEHGPLDHAYRAAGPRARNSKRIASTVRPRNAPPQLAELPARPARRPRAVPPRRRSGTPRRARSSTATGASGTRRTPRRRCGTLARAAEEASPFRTSKRRSRKCQAWNQVHRRDEAGERVSVEAGELVLVEGVDDRLGGTHPDETVRVDGDHRTGAPPRSMRRAASSSFSENASAATSFVKALSVVRDPMGIAPSRHNSCEVT